MKTRTNTAARPGPEPAAAAAAAAAPAPESATLANLQTAYNGETNAQARYLAFAREAGDEGYAPVVSLFRAAAHAEEIHAANHAEAIRHFGAQPKASAEPAIVKSTRENLEAAVKGESYERDEMYPAFLRQARSDGIPSAARTFHLAKKSETEHAALFSLALHELERLRGGSVVYYVCPVCGFTSSKADDTRCPVCATPVNRFEKVS